MQYRLQVDYLKNR